MIPHNTLAYYPNGDGAILNFFADLWSDNIPSWQQNTYRRLGSFYRDIGSTRVVSINTLYLFTSNNAISDCGGDSKSAGDLVLDWLDDALLNATMEGRSVYLSGHIPPSVMTYAPHCYKIFSKLCITYKNIIHGQFYGHLSNSYLIIDIDHFYFPVPDLELSKHPLMRLAPRAPGWVSKYIDRLMSHYDSLTHVSDLPSPVFVSPSIVPAFNPGFRIFTFWQGGLIGYTQYFMDMEKTLTWTVEYTTQDYRLQFSGKRDWYHFAKKLVSRKHMKLKDLFFKNIFVGR